MSIGFWGEEGGGLVEWVVCVIVRGCRWGWSNGVFFGRDSSPDVVVSRWWEQKCSE